MLNSARLKDHLRSGVWAECAMTVTFLSNITSVRNKETCPYQLLLGCKSKLPESLRSFGDIGVATTKDQIQCKLSNRGTPCMFVGYDLPWLVSKKLIPTIIGWKQFQLNNKTLN